MLRNHALIEYPGMIGTIRRMNNGEDEDNDDGGGGGMGNADSGGHSPSE